MARIFGIAGWKNSGKTTLVEGVVRELVKRGLRVATMKHAHHGFDIDHEGRDSYRHREAGASEVIVASSKRWAIVHELRGEDEPSFQEMLAKLSPADIVIVEGFKKERYPKLEVIGPTPRDTPLYLSDESVVAVAGVEPINAGLPYFDRDDISGIVDFILRQTDLTS